MDFKKNLVWKSVFNIYFYNYKVTNVVKSERVGPQGTQPPNTFLLSDDVKDGKNTRQILSLRVVQVQQICYNLRNIAVCGQHISSFVEQEVKFH